MEIYLEATMVTPKPGCLKKVQFCAALALLLGGLESTAAEVIVPPASFQQEVQRELTEKAEALFARKLDECRARQREEERNPRYPVRIADRKASSGGGSASGKAQLRVM
jgi:hypothetical protein